MKFKYLFSRGILAQKKSFISEAIEIIGRTKILILKSDIYM